MKKKDAVFVSFKNYPSIHQPKSNNQIYIFSSFANSFQKKLQIVLYPFLFLSFAVFSSAKWFHASDEYDAHPLKVAKTLLTGSDLFVIINFVIFPFTN